MKAKILNDIRQDINSLDIDTCTEAIQMATVHLASSLKTAIREEDAEDTDLYVNAMISLTDIACVMARLTQSIDTLSQL